jgi:hypothetical protein
MAFDLEAGRQYGRAAGDAALDLEDAIARPADEMVMMALVRHFVPNDAARELDRAKPPVVQEHADCPVDGGKPKQGHTKPDAFLDFQRRQRTIGDREFITNRALLACLGESTWCVAVPHRLCHLSELTIVVVSMSSMPK